MDGRAMNVEIARSLDLRGLSGHEMTEQAAQAIRKLGPGALVEVLGDDPASAAAFASWSSATGSDLLESSRFGTLYRFVVRRRAAGRPER
ncbi:MAG: sulfurtransferase TusA family protein [Candidatus Limnocylindria bacterium]|nr:sulfurtransferase TusA family protein [Candidatus Limnocylindria bacterium]